MLVTNTDWCIKIYACYFPSSFLSLSKINSMYYQALIRCVETHIPNPHNALHMHHCRGVLSLGVTGLLKNAKFATVFRGVLRVNYEGDTPDQV